MDRFKCREASVADLGAGGFRDHIEDLDNQGGHCYRCHEVVESRLSKQWFVKMKPLAEPAIEAVKSGEVRFVPDRWSKIYFNWMNNIQDWCISRQLWWGHRIPAYTCPKCGELIVAPTAPTTCPKCGASSADGQTVFDQDPDVLDTWFSSWLWPFSTLGWPEKTNDLDFYYPTTDLVTAQDIIFFWVARMMMAGIHFMKKPPFRNIVIHGIVRDAQGRKMSKSLGNSLDPLKIIEEYSADALRFSLALITSLDCDSKVDMKKFEVGRNFATKIWNAARFMQMQEAAGGFTRNDGQTASGQLTSDEQHILYACDLACRKMNDLLGKYRIQDGALAVYDFFWTQICDWYVEYAKDAPDKARAFSILRDVYWKALCLLHPYMPFVTEEIAHQLGYLKDDETILKAAFPKGLSDEEKAKLGLTEEIYEFVNAKREMITALRALRAEYKVNPAAFVKVTIDARDAATADRLRAEEANLKAFMRAEAVEIVSDGADRAMPGTLGRLGTVYLSLEGLVDKAAEAKRIAAELEKTRGFIKSIDAKLANENFVAHAPAAVVEGQKTKRAELVANVEKLEKLAKLFA